MMLNQESISEYIPKTPKRHPLQIYYYHCDQVGTPLALISDTGNVDWAIELDPFGNVLAENGSDKIYQPIRMQGQQYDEETGLHYNRYRYYDPQVGRYISQDPIGLQGGMNNYIYPLNPNQAVDPLGLQVPGCNINPTNIPTYEQALYAPPVSFNEGTTSAIGGVSGAIGGRADLNIGGSSTTYSDGSSDFCGLIEVCFGGGAEGGASASLVVERSNRATTTGVGYAGCVSGETTIGGGATGSICSDLGQVIDGDVTAGSVSGGFALGAKGGVSGTACTRLNVCTKPVRDGVKKLFNWITE